MMRSWIRSILKASVVVITTFAFTMLILFTLINFMLNCQSWDESYWTETSSCITPKQFIGGFIRHE